MTITITSEDYEELLEENLHNYKSNPALETFEDLCEIPIDCFNLIPTFYPITCFSL